MTLAEAPLVSPGKALTYIDEQSGELDMMIQFQCVCADCLFTDWLPMPFSLRKLKRAFSGWQRKLHGRAWNMLYLENHDHPRIVSRYGSERFREESAKMLAAALLFQQGTPFLYQGQELGMTNCPMERIDEYRDVQTIWNYHHTALKQSPEKRLARLHRSSRDNSRTPVQWSGEPNAGFTTGTPWMRVNPNYVQINAAEQETREDSVLNFYRRAIALRKSLSCVRDGDYREYRPLSGSHYLYSRDDGKQRILVVCSFRDKPTAFRPPRGFDPAAAQLALCNYQASTPGTLQPYECRVYLWT